jgi:hypothetical protein
MMDLSLLDLTHQVDTETVLLVGVGMVAHTVVVGKVPHMAAVDMLEGGILPVRVGMLAVEVVDIR